MSLAAIAGGIGGSASIFFLGKLTTEYKALIAEQNKVAALIKAIDHVVIEEPAYLASRDVVGMAYEELLADEKGLVPLSDTGRQTGTGDWEKSLQSGAAADIYSAAKTLLSIGINRFAENYPSTATYVGTMVTAGGLGLAIASGATGTLTSVLVPVGMGTASYGSICASSGNSVKLGKVESERDALIIKWQLLQLTRFIDENKTPGTNTIDIGGHPFALTPANWESLLLTAKLYFKSSNPAVPFALPVPPALVADNPADVVLLTALNNACTGAFDWDPVGAQYKLKVPGADRTAISFKVNREIIKVKSYKREHAQASHSGDVTVHILPLAERVGAVEAKQVEDRLALATERGRIDDTRRDYATSAALAAQTARIDDARRDIDGTRRDYATSAALVAQTTRIDDARRDIDNLAARPVAPALVVLDRTEVIADRYNARRTEYQFFKKCYLNVNDKLLEIVNRVRGASRLGAVSLDYQQQSALINTLRSFRCKQLEELEDTDQAALSTLIEDRMHLSAAITAAIVDLGIKIPPFAEALIRKELGRKEFSEYDMLAGSAGAASAGVADGSSGLGAGHSNLSHAISEMWGILQREEHERRTEEIADIQAHTKTMTFSKYR